MSSKMTISAVFLALLGVFAAPRSEGAGLLISSDNAGAPMAIKSQRVTVTINDSVARTEVVQVFHNRENRPLEAVYVFPLPEGASIADFSMWVRGKEIKGELMDKRSARRHYDDITRTRRDPALLEHLEKNTFRISVSPVPARGDQKIKLVYTEVVNYRRGILRYTYPLREKKAAPTRVEQDLTLTVNVKSKKPILHVHSTTHPVDVHKARGGRTCVVGLEEPRSALDRDFTVLVSLKEKRSGITVLTYRHSPEEDGYFMALVTAPENDRLAKDIVFVLDTSGSMVGDKIIQAREALTYCIDSLNPEDRFNVIRFSTSVERLSVKPIAANRRGKARGRRFVNGFRAAGGTNIDMALREALRDAVDAKRPAAVLFLTDGNPTVGETDIGTLIDRVKRRAEGARGPLPKVHVFGVGAQVNTRLLDSIAEASQASRAYVEPGEDILSEVTDLYDRIRSPVLTGLELATPMLNSYDIFPQQLPSLYEGRQLVVTGRYKGGGPAAVKVNATGADGPVVLAEETNFPVAIDREETTLPRLWAMRKIGALADAIRLHGRSKELVDEIVSLSKKHAVVTPYTSYLVLESERMYRDRGIKREQRRTDGTRVDPRAPVARRREPEAVVEGPVFVHEEVEVTDHAETDNDVERRAADGQEDAIVSLPLGGTGVVGNIGVGGGGAGCFGYRSGGGRKRAVATFGGSRASEAAVNAALRWLAIHQEPNGSWSPARHGGPREGEDRITATGLSLVAFLGAGHTERAGKFRPNVCAALRYLMTQQGEDGRVGRGPRSAEAVSRHAIAAWALAEAYGMARNPKTGQAAQSAVDYSISRLQKEYSGWGATPRGEPRTDVTVWFIMQLKSARIAGLKVDGKGFAGGMSFLDSVADDRTGMAGLLKGGETSREATAMALVCRILCGAKSREPAVAGAADHVVEALPRWDRNSDVDFRHWYFGTMSMFQLGGRYWNGWNGALRDLLVGKQRKGGDDDGSWDPVGRGSSAGGRVYSTALGALMLEVYYRYLPVYSSGGRYSRTIGMGAAPAPGVSQVPDITPGGPAPETGEEAVRRSEEIRRLREADHIGGGR